VNTDQLLLFALLICTFGFLIWGKFRYDLIAFSALIIAVVIGLVPAQEAFEGFGHPATIVIAMVLVISRGFSNSGVVEFIADKFVNPERPLSIHIGIMSAISGLLSAIMNNVAALALLMPVDVQAAAKAKRSPALTLMPLSFASILGGMVTLIGTPPNIIIATFRQEAVGEPFGMFDFTPVGLTCAIAGTLFVALIGWRLIPGSRAEHDTRAELHELESYVGELQVPEEAPAIGKTVSELDAGIDDDDVQILGLMRAGHFLPGRARRTVIKAGDILAVEATPEAMEKVISTIGCEIVEAENKKLFAEGSELKMREVVVPPDAMVGWYPARALRTLERYGVSLLGVSRRGKSIHRQRRGTSFQAGDILLLIGPEDGLDNVIQVLRYLPLAERGLQVIQREKARLSTSIFAIGIAAAGFGLIPLPIALGAVVTLFVVSGIVPLRELYESVEWSVIVLLGALIPIGQALETTGGTALIVDGLLAVASDQSPVILLTILMIVTMTLSDVLNNTATAVVAAPIGIDLANRLGVSADPFLMAVAVAASCAFLTPIGHKNNTLILGPGGYSFGDYWRMGLPLEILIVAVGVPTILVVWPF